MTGGGAPYFALLHETGIIDSFVRQFAGMAKWRSY